MPATSRLPWPAPRALPPERDRRDRGPETKEPLPKGPFPAEKKTAEKATEKPAEKSQPAAAESRPKGQPASALAGPQEKLAVPDLASQQQAVEIIRETYKADYRAADKATLVSKLLEKAEESKSDPPARFDLLQEVKKLAVEARARRSGV